MTFERVPGDLDTCLSGYRPLRMNVSQNTLHVALKDEESRVLSLVMALASRGRVLRIEISGASLEDIFIELTQRGVRA
jgi:ABC-type uncharacterized transport system ATPase subunit